MRWRPSTTSESCDRACTLSRVCALRMVLVAVLTALAIAAASALSRSTVSVAPFRLAFFSRALLCSSSRFIESSTSASVMCAYQTFNVGMAANSAIADR